MAVSPAPLSSCDGPLQTVIKSRGDEQKLLDVLFILLKQADADGDGETSNVAGSLFGQPVAENSRSERRAVECERLQRAARCEDTDPPAVPRQVAELAHRPTPL